MTNAKEKISAARNYKDSVFRMLFREKAELLVLYNAVNGTDYSNPEDLKITTLESAIYMSMKNDLFRAIGNFVEFPMTQKRSARMRPDAIGKMSAKADCIWRANRSKSFKV